MPEALPVSVVAGASNAADGLSVGVGADYSTGDYGSDTTTEIWSVPFNVRYASDNWTWKATLPWMRVDGDASVVPGLGNVGNSNPKGRGRGNGNGNGGGDPTAPATTDTGSASLRIGVADVAEARHDARVTVDAHPRQCRLPGPVVARVAHVERHRPDLGGGVAAVVAGAVVGADADGQTVRGIRCTGGEEEGNGKDGAGLHRNSWA